MNSDVQEEQTVLSTQTQYRRRGFRVEMGNVCYFLKTVLTRYLNFENKYYNSMKKLY